MRAHHPWLAAASGAAFLLTLGALGACIAIAPDGIRRETDEPDASDPINTPDSSPPENPKDSGTPDPHAVLGVEPAHGPFNGGQRVLIKGKGFTSKARVWFDGIEADQATAVPIDPTRVQIAAPPGKAGTVDVRVQNGEDASTSRNLVGGYTYDALYAVPDSGPVPGGTVIEIVGQGTSWDATTVALIDNKPCTSLVVGGPTHLTCTVPAGSPGAKSIRVTKGSETISVLDAFTYEDSDNGYKGGLSGAPLNGSLKVLVYDNYSGSPIPGAYVLVGDDAATALTGQADSSGVLVFNDASLTSPKTVTVTGYCHSPISFVAEPVDTVTAYLDPILSPACASMGDPPPVGGKPVNLGTATGELVWESADEFKKGDWNNIPPAIAPNERRAAYVFVASGDPGGIFQLPSDPNVAVTELSPGERGYGFSLNMVAGNRSIYALAGIEDRTVNPPKFTAYAMGAVKGVPILPQTLTDSVFIAMNKTLDQALTMTIAPPAPGPKGPDRLRATVTVTLGNDGYAILPAGFKQPYLPVQGSVSFIGLPVLTGALSGSVYVSNARAVTGQAATAPLSAIGRVLTNSTSTPVDMSGFMSLPTLVTPAANTAWNGEDLQATFPPSVPSLDLVVYDVQSGNGLVHWLIAVPGASGTVAKLPNIQNLPNAALPPGPLSISVYGAHIDDFNYGKLLYRHLRPQGMSRYSLDIFNAHL